MRLINVSTLQLDWFADEEHVPSYAILSHTWGEGEVSIYDFTSPGRTAATDLLGYRKIELVCRQAQLDGLTYAWVDTCCIDKTSSAELTEAINSMYEWYRKADVCYTFLVDLAPHDPLVEGDDEDGAQKPSAAFANSRWFTRGWTLQELIAPKTVRFYDNAWVLRGTKKSLAPLISTITRIEEPVLRGTIDISMLPIARRMAWAAGRTTTRAEDMAYCLLGIFDVNMPMMYGERRKAFIRLQEAIMHESNDTSLFAWQAKPGGLAFRGILAESPAEFSEAGGIENGSDTRFDTEFSITNKGVRMNINTWNADGKQIFPLKCRLGGKPVAIRLHQHGAGVYARAKPDSLLIQSDDEEWKIHGVSISWGQTPPLYISKTVSPALSVSLGLAHKYGIHLRGGFHFSDTIRTTKSDSQGSGIVRVTWVHPSDQWDSARGLFLTGSGENFTGVAVTSGGDLDTMLIIVGIKGGKPWASFVDMVHVSMDQASALWNLENLSRMGREVGTRSANGFQLEIVTDVVDGETVFCVDVTKSLSQVKSLVKRSDKTGGGNRRLSIDMRRE